MAIGMLVGCLAAVAFAEPLNSPNLQKDGTLRPLSAQEGLKLIEVPAGFQLELVASEPMVQEPVCFAFDPDGALFVCEWNTYMQDQYATGQYEPKCRVVKLEDTNGDGKFDKRTVFADGLVLPRSIIALHDRILVRMSNDNTIWAFFDDNKDGIADRKEVALAGGPVGGNIEHQDDSLVWNVDNRIYETSRALRFKDGKLQAVKNIPRYGQWGLAHDDVGRLYGSGNSTPVQGWQSLGGYPNVTPPSEDAVKYANFICEVDDATDPGHDVTATGGQTMLRTSQFGRYTSNYVIPDPVRRCVKIVAFEERDGVRVAVPHPDFKGTEFIRSPDTYFRPVWTDIGPDGGLYIADMSRGIVQESQWFPTERTQDPNPRWIARYYRAKEWGMLGVHQRGRIWRLVPKDKKLLDPRPALSAKSSTELVGLLGHANGWWRDTAQKLIVCREDKSAVPALRTALTAANPNSRLLAMRCLQGLDSLTPSELTAALKDADENVRTNAVAIVETMPTQDPALEAALTPLLTDASSTVLSQLYLTLGNIHTPTAAKALKELAEKNPKNGSLALLQKAGQKLPQNLEPYRAGHTIFTGFCKECHGDGVNGLKVEGGLMAPVFAKNNRIKDPSYLVHVLLKGLQGPLGTGETYAAGMMPPLETMYKDDQLAAVANYIGVQWAGWKTPVTPEDVAKWRAEAKDKQTPYTFEELKGIK
ncbi:MAG: HEAT repeat domain-containing protein [Luteolibacter sp.]